MLQLPKTDPIKLAKLEPILLRAKIDVPVITSFGVISERTSLLIRAEDTGGAVGWGEVFGNFPIHGAENRKHIIEDYIAILALSKTWESPLEAFNALTAKTHVLTLQSGEPGPFAQSIAGVDIALWDLAARRADIPLWKFLGEKVIPYRPMQVASIRLVLKISWNKKFLKGMTPLKLKLVLVARKTCTLFLK